MNSKLFILSSLIIIGMFLLVKGIRAGLFSYGLIRRSQTTQATIDCLDEGESGFEKYYVIFNDGNSKVKRKLMMKPTNKVKKGDIVTVTFDPKNSKRVMLKGEHVYRYVSASMLMTGAGLYIINNALLGILSSLT